MLDNNGEEGNRRDNIQPGMGKKKTKRVGRD